MTNLEKIRNMTIEELAVFLCAGDKACEGCKYENDPQNCHKEIGPYIRWLLKDATEEDKGK